MADQGRVLKAFAVAVLLATASASAQAPPPSAAPTPAAPTPAEAAAADLKRKGDVAMESLHYSDALDAYEQAYLRDPKPALLYNIGRALETLGRFPEALEKLQAFQTNASPELLARVPKLQELIASIRQRVSDLTVHASVKGAQVLLRKQLVGKTPLDHFGANAGKADIEVIADGFLPYRASVELPGASALSIEAKLEPLDERAILLVKASVPGARVFVDSKLVGMAPSEAIVFSGKHIVRLEKEGFEETQSSVFVKRGERKTLTLTLSETPPLIARWWFWAGVGTVAAGGVAITAALLTERSPDSGDIPPGQLPAP